MCPRSVGRLTSEEWLSDSDVGIYSFTYEFDAAGNRSLLTKDGVTTYYSYNTLNQLTLAESTEGALTYYTYQADGALATKHDADGWTYYEWDVDEALLRVMRDGTVTGQANELYDAQMKRVARELDGTATYYVFDGEKIARVEQPEAGTRDFYVQEGESIYSPLVSVHDEAADAQYWYLFDALGSTMGLVDANGNLSGKLQYDAFGNVLAEENVPRSAFFKYVGAYQYMPEEFEDMMLLWHRWYDPTVGRFVGRDAVLRAEAYWYACSNPVTIADAAGLQPRSVAARDPFSDFLEDHLRAPLMQAWAWLAMATAGPVMWFATPFMDECDPFRRCVRDVANEMWEIDARKNPHQDFALTFWIGPYLYLLNRNIKVFSALLGLLASIAAAYRVVSIHAAAASFCTYAFAFPANDPSSPNNPWLGPAVAGRPQKEMGVWAS